ncbi:MBL fold metallo-hydrolase [Paenibacillus ferrarius]|uniref:MBL fold metallo-hydrolase n=1 Tax=Paenibacillus ferrarius TaxID=1469647 RepID=UPI001FC9FAF2|nr:MBL fold metallo-hydrolase [Paenibacillus ferrarius]
MEDQVDFYVQEAQNMKMDISYVIDTHLHADHISGARELARKTGAKYVLHQSAETNFDFMPVKDGDEIVAGNTILKFLHTPGHTPEHISIIVTDRVRGEEPWFLITGHTLMVGDVGRTELAGTAEEGARHLYNSVYNKLLQLPDHLELFAGAYAGSVCGRTLSGKPSSTIGFEKKCNKALQFQDEDAFVSFMLKDIPEQPAKSGKMR